MAKSGTPVVDVKVEPEIVPVEAPRLSEADFIEAARHTKAKLDAMPKVTIRIPFPPEIDATEAASMPKPPCEVVGINGRNFQIRKGVDVEVPIEVANILRRANKI